MKDIFPLRLPIGVLKSIVLREFCFVVESHTHLHLHLSDKQNIVFVKRGIKKYFKISFKILWRQDPHNVTSTPMHGARTFYI